MNNHSKIKYLILYAFLLFATVALFLLFRNWYPAYLSAQGDKAYDKKNFVKAEEFYRKALGAKPDNSKANLRLGIILYNKNAPPDGALSFLSKAAGMDSNNAENFYYQGLIYEKMNKPDQAVDSYKKSLALDPGMAGALFSLAKLNYRKGRVDEAIVQMEKALDCEKPPRDIYKWLLWCYEKEKNTVKMDSLFAKFLDKSAQNPFDFGRISTYYERTGNLLLAENILKRGVTAYGNDTSSYYLLGQFYRRQKRQADAAKIYEAALQADPNSHITYFYLGLTFYEMKDPRRAEEEMKRSLAIRPNAPESLNMLAWIYLTAPPESPQYKPKDALFYARKAAAISQVSAYVDTLARACYATGDYDGAKANFNENLRRNRNLPYTYYGLAVSSFRQGKDEGAPDNLKKALDLGFNDTALIVHDLDIPSITNEPRIQAILKVKGK
jgi:tetratricopeptide (TPR) repeat protein